MIAFALRPANERAEVFEETSARLGIGRAAIVEKDFWVCWTLAQLYGEEGPSSTESSEPKLVFKGGTSLSKVYGLIDRFSEDVDLTVDRQGLIEKAQDPDEESISIRERKRRFKRVATECENYVRLTIAPFLLERLSKIGGSVEIDQGDEQTIRMRYPPSLHARSYGMQAYVSAEVRLEFGARGALWPSEMGEVTPYAAQTFPTLFEQKSTRVWALSPTRTFWEKATILHAIAEGNTQGSMVRQSRHYSDLASLAASELGGEAVRDSQLLLEVASHKANSFPSAKARYDLAKPGTLRLVPSEELVRELELDYEQMKEMFISEPPPFVEVMRSITELETAINKSATSEN